jgi:hypothetical protein
MRAHWLLIGLLLLAAAANDLRRLRTEKPPWTANGPLGSALTRVDPRWTLAWLLAVATVGAIGVLNTLL